jgi:hypothetical protein
MLVERVLFLQVWLFMCEAKRTLCIAFRGTEQDGVTDFLTDAKLYPWCGNCWPTYFNTRTALSKTMAWFCT